ncbi:MAG: hypothetical protein PF570_07825, partial [Candidatus Cloacimonetes bacterium]|nr:hypothetical protein [Candidatus Cloacimonadota bacterium]
IIINSEKIYIDSLVFGSKEYQIDYKKGIITFNRALGNCIIEYYIYPQHLANRFYLFQTQEFSDTTDVKMIRASSQQFYDNTDLNITGSKTISISVANNEDFDLDQSLFLKINGKLSDEMSIEAQLSDSQTPITPEGDSRELSSLDKIFIRLYGEKYELAFGDLEMDFDNSSFMKYSTKFEGLKAGWSGNNKLTGALAISKGKKITDSFDGTEAKQGPYYLSVEGTSGVQVVPGSEEVFLNGQQMQRGTDYSIDYSEGGITFSNQHFISSTSNIRVTFQYSDENYNQNMYLASSEVNVSDDFKISSNVIIQNDDRNNPLQDTYSEDDINALEAAGDETAWVSGISEAEDGEYELSQDELYYYYVGSDSTIVGHFNIHFEYMGNNNGDYDYNSEGAFYEYVGIGNGSYLPLKKLPLPQSKLNYDLSLKYSGESYSLAAEGLFTSNDKNTFSDVDDDDNNDFASRFSVRLFPDYDKINPDLKLMYEKLGGDLATFAQLQSAADAHEFTQLPDSLNSEEYSAEISMNILELYSPHIIYKQKQIADYADQQYISVTSNIKQKNFFPQLYHRYLSVKQTTEDQQIQNSNIEQHDLQSKYSFGKFVYGLDYFNRNNEYEIAENSKVIERNSRWKTQLETANLKWITSRIFGELKNDHQRLGDNQDYITQHDETSYTFGIETFLNTVKHRVKIALTHRQVKDNKREITNDFDIADISARNVFFKDFVNINSTYSLRNIEFYPKIKEFQYVGEDTGSFDVDTLFVGYFQGDYDWEVIQIDYDNPEMSVEINASLSLHLTPKMITNSFLKKFQTETYIMITENSREEDKMSVYILNPNVLMHSETTIYGRRILRQSLSFDILERKLTSKLGYKLEETLDSRYNEETAKKDQETWDAELRVLTFENTNMELHYDHMREEDSHYNSHLDLDEIELDIQNKLSSDVTLKSSVSYSYEKGNDAANDNQYTISAFEFEESASYFYKRKYRFFAKASYKRNYRDGSGFLSFLADKKEGNIFKWDVNMDYRMSNYTSLNLQYSGNSYPEEKQVHKLSVEVKAEF